MTVSRTGDGDPTKSPTLGGGPLGADVFDFGYGVPLFLQPKPIDRPLMAVSARPVDFVPPPQLPFSPGGEGANDGGDTGSPPGDAPGSGNPGGDGDG